MNIFMKLFSKKKNKDNLTTDINSQNVLSNYNPHFDETVMLKNDDCYEELPEASYVKKINNNDTVPITNFELDDFGETVLLSDNDFKTSDETVLLNNNNNESKTEEINGLKLLSHIFLMNPLSGEKINIYKQIFTIGSGNDVDCKICKSSISNNHASIFIKNAGEFYVVDNGSTNGSQVEGVSIEPMKMVSIENGDLIAFGDELYQFYIEE